MLYSCLMGKENRIFINIYGCVLGYIVYIKYDKNVRNWFCVMIYLYMDKECWNVKLKGCKYKIW